MANDLNLQDNADIIESAICQFDVDCNRAINDNIALRLIELLLDRYYLASFINQFTLFISLWKFSPRRHGGTEKNQKTSILILSLCASVSPW